MKTVQINLKTIIFIAIIASIILFFNLAKNIIQPFIYSIAIAYILNSLVVFISKKFTIQHNYAVNIIFTSFLISVILIAFFIMPLLYRQITSLITNLPSYINNFFDNINPIINNFLINKQEFFNSEEVTAKISSGIISYFSQSSQNITASIWHSSISVLNVFSIIFIAPILIFYFLKDWNKMINNVNNLIPKNNYSFIKKIITEIDCLLIKYLQGQFNVCMILALFYGISLSLTSLSFGLLIGLLTGFFSFIPFVAIVLGFAISIIVGIFDWGFDFYKLSLISGIFIFGQFIEGNFITPKLIGEKIGIHPLWIIFSLFFFGSILGFVGIIFAMPLTAIISVFIKHLVEIYRNNFTK